MTSTTLACLALAAATALGTGSTDAPAQAPATSDKTGTVLAAGQTLALRQPADPVIGKITPARDADTRGMFAPQVDWPLVPIHAALLPNGKLVTYGAPLGQLAQGGLDYDEWDPAAGFGPGGHEHSPSMHDYNSFCNAAVLLPDGRIMMLGGNSTMMSMLFDPITGEQSMGGRLNKDRWYGSLLRLPDDRVLALGGGNYYNTDAYLRPNDDGGVATTPEVTDASGRQWRSLPGARSSLAFGARDSRWWYPRAYNARNGKVFGISSDRLWRLDAGGNGALSAAGTLPFFMGVSGSSVVYAPGKLLVAGGGQRANYTAETATAAAAAVDMSGAGNAAVNRLAPMGRARNWLNLTALPTGEVLANGGTTRGTDGGAANSAYQAEMWNPGSGAWRGLASAQRIRTYHSVSVLMPSGQVITGGGGLPGPEDNRNAESFLPPYLFAKKSDGSVGWADRPEIRTLAGSVTYGGRLTMGLKDNRRIASASLISLSSITHSYDSGGQRTPLAVTQNGASASVTLPSGPSALAPGSYQLSVVDSKGVPSPAQIITVRKDGSRGTVSIFPRDRNASPAGGQTGDVTQPGVVKPKVGERVGLEPTNFFGYRVRHAGYKASLAPIGRDSGALAKADSSFTVRAGLADGSCYSLEANNFPGWYLRLAAPTAQVSLERRAETAEFRRGATFCPEVGQTGQFTSFKAYGTNRYLRHRGYQLFADAPDGNPLTRQDMTFALRPALQPFLNGDAYGLESTNLAGQRVRHQNFNALLSPISESSSALAKADATWVARAGLADGSCTSLESRNYPGSYLRARPGDTAGLDRSDGSAGFRASATWCPTTGISGEGWSLRNFAAPTKLLRHRGGQVVTDPNDGSDQTRAEASFLCKLAM